MFKGFISGVVITVAVLALYFSMKDKVVKALTPNLKGGVVLNDYSHKNEMAYYHQLLETIFGEGVCNIQSYSSREEMLTDFKNKDLDFMISQGGEGVGLESRDVIKTEHLSLYVKKGASKNYKDYFNKTVGFAADMPMVDTFLQFSKLKIYKNIGFAYSDMLAGSIDAIIYFDGAHRHLAKMWGADSSNYEAIKVPLDQFYRRIYFADDAEGAELKKKFDDSFEKAKNSPRLTFFAMRFGMGL